MTLCFCKCRANADIMANVKPQPDMIVVTEPGDGIEALALIKKALPDMVLLDLRMPQMDKVGCSCRGEDVATPIQGNHRDNFRY